jgi:hypothetical protein
MDNLPRTLVVTEAPFGLNNGFGVTLNTFFSGWDTERLFVLYTRQETAAPDDRSDRSAFADVPGPPGRRHAAAFLLGRRPTWRGRYSALWLRRTLRGWRPDVVYTMVFSGETLAFATWVAGRLRVPLVAHVADDGLETQKGGVSATIGQLLAGAAARISISEEMRQEYSDRYGVDSHVLHNGAADDLLPILARWPGATTTLSCATSGRSSPASISRRSRTLRQRSSRSRTPACRSASRSGVEAGRSSTPRR